MVAEPEVLGNGLDVGKKKRNWKFPYFWSAQPGKKEEKDEEFERKNQILYYRCLLETPVDS